MEPGRPTPYACRTDGGQSDEEATPADEASEDSGRGLLPEAGDPSDEDDLGMYEWGGGLAAGLGFFLTPIFTAPIACYCAMRLRHEKPISMYVILVIVASTVVFWWIVLWSVMV